MTTRVGSLIRKKRFEANKMSLRDLATMMGVTHVFLGEIERGERPLPLDRVKSVLESLPNMEDNELREAMAQDRPVEVDVRKAPPAYQRLAVALARRVENEDLHKKQLDELLKLLTKQSK